MRRVLAVAGVASVAATLALLPAAPGFATPVSGGATASAGCPTGSGPGTTVTGPHLYDPATGQQFTCASTVTVSQAGDLVNQLVNVSWTGFTPSVIPSGQPWYQYSQGSATDYSVMVAECRGTSPSSPADCSGAGNAGVPIPRDANGIVNTAYAITTSQGTGQVPIDIQTALQNKPLGCDQAHPCSLVVVPGQGGVPASGGTPANCADHSQDVNSLGTGNAAPINTFTTSTGACSWADRIVIPLSFAPVPSGCPLRTPAFSAAGSPMLADAMQQWQTKLCAGAGGLTITYSSEVGEQLAASETASGSSTIALVTRPAAAQGVSTGSKRFLYAPVAVSAVAIAYWMDDNTTGQPQTGLKLNQRLLAKLLTTSYDPSFADDKGIQGNPFSLFAPDPEFAALNPQIVKNITFFSSQSFVIPDVMQGGSDMTWTLTRWIAADPTAAAFLRGTPAPGGMHVNTYYRGVKYPTGAFIAQDPSLEYSHLYNPVFGLANVVNYQAIGAFPGDSWIKDQNGNYPALPPEPVGNRALIAVLDQGDAARNHFPVAAIPNAAGQYVLPGNASMAAALSHMVSGGDGTLEMNLADTDPSAYPLTMVIYAMVPARGLCHSQAADVARFLSYVAGPGQSPGLRPGQLPPGYLPLTASLQAQTRRDASQVAGETCTRTGNPGGGLPTTASNPSPRASLTPSPGASISLPLPGLSGVRIKLAAARSRPAPLTRFILPALLILGGAAALGGSSVLLRSAEGGLAAGLRRLRRAPLKHWRKR